MKQKIKSFMYKFWALHYFWRFAPLFYTFGMGARIHTINWEIKLPCPSCSKDPKDLVWHTLPNELIKGFLGVDYLEEWVKTRIPFHLLCWFENSDKIIQFNSSGFLACYEKEDLILRICGLSLLKHKKLQNYFWNKFMYQAYHASVVRSIFSQLEDE